LIHLVYQRKPVLMRGASSKQSIKELRRELRQRQTDAEVILWAAIRNRQLNGKKFRRQHSFDTFIVDFYCHEHLLVVELDGSVHNTAEARLNDAEREAILCDLGLTVLRFSNDHVFTSLNKVLQKIGEYLR
jgi:very-short-patch-repair endonuclease